MPGPGLDPIGDGVACLEAKRLIDTYREVVA